MTKKAIISQAELKRMADVATSEGVTIEVEREGTIVRVMPFAPPTTSGQKLMREEESRSALDAWIASHEKTPQAPRRSREPDTGAGGYPIVDDPHDPLKRWYDDLGFDPRTMDEADMTRLMAEAHAKWMASIPGTKIGKREEAALRKLAAIGVNVRVLETEVKGCGNETMDRLQARGFIGRRQTLTEEEVRDNRTLEEIWLLKEGLDAWELLK
ncbi:hypothetical protein [Rhizobium grahamii]|uniref:hypothetical protein n=1 Tax=Rhizobium grahamii TaxID=1120045 RepID=UPI00167BF4DB|nr:hypothetical protein [Rhizobium grahamii]